MLKRLLTAVLILAVFMVFTGTAISAPDNTPGPRGKVIVKNATTPSVKEKAPFVAQRAGGPDYTDILSRPAAHRTPPPSASGLDTTECHLLEYYIYDPLLCDNLFSSRSNSPFPANAERFDGPTAPNTVIKVNACDQYVYWTAEGASPDGVVLIKASVWTDNAGLPGTMVYTETFALPVIAYPGQYVHLAFTNPPTVSGAYHIAVGADPSSPTTDSLFLGADYGNRAASGSCPAGTHTPTFRSSRYDATLLSWVPMATSNGFTCDFDLYSEWCQVYSSCYTAVTPSNGFVGLFLVPDPAWTCGSILRGFGQRFVSTGPDTIKSVDFQHYDYSLTYGAGAFYPLTGTNGVIIKIWKDDGTGNIDTVTGPLATQTIPGGLASLFPTTGGNGTHNGWNHLVVTFPTPPVIIGPWHVTAEMTSSNDADGAIFMPLNSSTSDPGRVGGSVAFTAPDHQWIRSGLSNCWTLDGLGERAFFIHVGVCHDEFSICDNQLSYTAGTSTGYGLPINIAQRFDGQQINRIEKIRVQAIDPALFAENGGTPDMLIKVWGSAGPAGPGVLLATYPVPFAGITYYPGWTEVVIPGGLQVVSSSFYVGYELSTLDPVNNYFYFGVEEDAGPLIRGGAWYYSTGSAIWKNLSVATGATDNAVIEVEFCSVPPNEWTCATPDDYATAGHDFARTGHANVALGDAYCKLTAKWSYTDPNVLAVLGRVGSGAPIVYDTFVVCNFGTKYQILSLNTGSVLKTITGSGGPNYITNSGGLACTPTIALITIGGTPTHVLFLGGGTTQSIDAFNMDDGLFSLIWSINSTTYAGLGYPGTLGNTAFVNFVVLNLGGIDYLYFCTGGVRLYQAVAATGHLGTWAPISFQAPTYRGLASDGSSLYLTQAALPPGVPNGDVYSINPATGALNWQLSTAVGGGLRGNNGSVYTAGTYGPETFPSGLAVAGGEVYTVSAPMLQPNPTAPADGVFYRINAASGAVKSAAASAHVLCWSSSGNLQQGNVIIDQNRVIVPCGSTWVTPPVGGSVLFYNRFTGLLAGAMYPGNHAGGSNAPRADGFLTCEPGVADQLFVGTTFGYMSVVNADNYQETFNRRIDVNPPFNAGADDRMAGLAIAKTGEVLVASLQGTLHCLSTQVPRPRLEIIDNAPIGNTYGPLASVLVDFGKVFTNTGCLPLTGNVHCMDSSNLSAPGASRHYQPPNASLAASIADRLTSNSLTAWQKMQPATANENLSTARRTLNRAAAAGVPVFVNGSGVYPFTLNPGDTAHIIVDVKQNLIKRGPNIFYADFESNDPDFFLNDPSEQPEVVMTIIGGCLIDTTYLAFGTGPSLVAIANTGRIAAGDWEPTTGPGTYSVEGFKTDVFQGSYIYGVSYARIALNSVDWHGGTEATAWVSLQADPNLCDVDCKPALSAIATLGSITSDGVTYTPLTGNLVCRTFLDSVQNFFDGAAWDWTLSPALFDPDSTMGLVTHSRVIGFTNAPLAYPELNGVFVDFMKIVPRTNIAVPNWRMGAIVDYDLGKDSSGYDASASMAWDFASTGQTRVTGAYGFVKLPFGGCGPAALPPMRNNKALNADQAEWNSTAALHYMGYLDSAYYDLNLVGHYSHSGLPGAGDQAMHVGFIAHDFTGDLDTLSFAMAQFCLPTIANPKDPATFRPLAHLLNKWVGMEPGDVNNDGALNIADIVYLAKYINGGVGTPGPIPFVHCGDVNGDGNVDAGDVTYLINYYFHYGACPVGKYITY